MGLASLVAPGLSHSNGNDSTPSSFEVMSVRFLSFPSSQALIHLQDTLSQLL